MKKTKIIASIGPASNEVKVFREMVKSGVNVARINFSHATIEERQKAVDTIVKVREELNENIAILYDTKGPEFRNGMLEEGSINLEEGKTIKIVKEEVLGNEERFSVNYPEVLDDLKEKDIILLENGLMKIEVIEKTNDYVNCRILSGGVLGNRKSLNVPNVKLNIPFISDVDYEDIVYACQNKADFIALSFVSSKEDVLKLGIQNGDIVCYDPKFTITDSGFLKTRFIDDKASVVVLLMLLKYVKENILNFKFDTKIYFVVYEEVGHGASMVDSSIDEFVTLDMGCVGLDLNGDEFSVSICAKDSGGPYDYELTTRLINLAKDNNLKYQVDIFPFYGSDVGAASRAGVDFKGALVGTGVSASHGMERTHMKGIENTLKLIYLYLIG